MARFWYPGVSSVPPVRNGTVPRGRSPEEFFEVFLALKKVLAWEKDLKKQAIGKQIFGS